MAEPTVEVLGVYRIRVTEELIQDRIECSYSDAKDTQARLALEGESREFLSQVVLVEALVRNRDARFDVGDFTQRVGEDKSHWQVAYAEAFLTPDGEALAAERWSNHAPMGDLRVTFYLHLWDASRPLASSYGDIVCPPAMPMPARLERLVPYENVD